MPLIDNKKESHIYVRQETFQCTKLWTVAFKLNLYSKTNTVRLCYYVLLSCGLLWNLIRKCIYKSNHPHYQIFSISSIVNPVYSTILSIGSPLSFIVFAIFRALIISPLVIPSPFPFPILLSIKACAYLSTIIL